MKDNSDCERSRVIESYRKHLWQQVRTGVITIDDLLSLKGKRLGAIAALSLATEM
jgi:hypothetical protein